MIRFEPVPEPAGFHERARVPGFAWLADNPDAKRVRRTIGLPSRELSLEDF